MERVINRLTKALNNSSSTSNEDLEKELLQKRIELDYILVFIMASPLRVLMYSCCKNFPTTEKYISLFPNEDQNLDDATAATAAAEQSKTAKKKKQLLDLAAERLSSSNNAMNNTNTMEEESLSSEDQELEEQDEDDFFE